MFFRQTCYFCDNIVINYSCHYVYSNIFDIADSRILNTKLSWTCLAIQPSNVISVGRLTVNIALLSTFLAVQYLWRNDVGFCWIVYLILFFSYNSISPCLV